MFSIQTMQDDGIRFKKGCKNLMNVKCSWIMEQIEALTGREIGRFDKGGDG